MLEATFFCSFLFIDIVDCAKIVSIQISSRILQDIG